MQIKTNGWLAAWRAVFAAVAVNILISFAASFIQVDIHTSMLITTAVYTVFALCFALFYGRKNIRAGLLNIGFRSFNPMLLPLLIFMPVASQMFCLFMTTPLTLLLQLLFGFETKEQILMPNGLRETALVFVYMCILAPVSEEILFRGVIYKYFSRRSVLDAVFWSAAAFSAAHLDIRSFLPIFFVGLVLSLFRFATGSVFASMIAHASMNLAGLLMMFIQEDSAIYTLTAIVLAVSFPFMIVWFLKHTAFPHMRNVGGKRGASVFLALTAAVFFAFQGYRLATNIWKTVQSGERFFDEFYEEFPNDFEYDFEYNFD